MNQENKAHAIAAKCETAGAGFEEKVRYQTALYHQNMPIAHLRPKQMRTFGYAPLPGAFQAGATSHDFSERPQRIVFKMDVGNYTYVHKKHVCYQTALKG